MLASLAGLALGRGRLVVGLAVLLGAGALALTAPRVDRLHPFSASDPGSESVTAKELVFEAVGLDPDAGLVAIVDTGAPVGSERAAERVNEVADAIFLDPAVARVQTAYSTGDRAMVSRDRRSSFIVANFATLSDREQRRAAERLRDRFDGDGDVTFGGEAPASRDGSDLVAGDIARAELIALPLMFLVALLFFRGLVAALLPPVVGVLATAGALFWLIALNTLLELSIFALNLVLGLALALAIDYSLILVSRYREELTQRRDQAEALRRTLATAGRTILFSSLAIAAAMASLLAFPQRFLYSMGVGGVLVATLSGLVALTVLPALLAILGERVNAGAPAWLQRRRDREAVTHTDGRWYRLADLITRRPIPVAVLTATLLVTLAVPFADARFAAIDTSVFPAGTESRVARERLRDEFPPNLSEPLFVVTQGVARDSEQALADEVRMLAGSDRVDDPVRIGAGVALIGISLDARPTSERAERLVERIRAIERPFEHLVGGSAADHLDEQRAVSDRLPLVLAILAVTTIVVLFAMTGSVLLPLKAVVMNFLSLGAAFGALVFIFQEGRLEGLLDYESTGSLEFSQPLVLLAIGFGIATDYGVFLLARTKEEWDASRNNDKAVAIALERTGRILTVAAALLVIATLAIATSSIVFIKELGVGIAIAVAVDATVVRALLVPALMALLGRWNWWAPGPLRRLHDRLAAAVAGA